jgi:predicted  nucleic acid-binding Zn-ribbon protein
VDILYINEEELQMLAELDDLLLSTADLESNISTTSSALAEAEDEARAVLEQTLVELNQGLETLEMEIATVQAELGQLRSTRERGEATFSASQQAIQQK